MTLTNIKKAWSLLDQRERRNAFRVLLVMVLGAFASAVMVGSVLPFLSVLSNPSMIQSEPFLAFLFQKAGFTSYYTFLLFLGLTSIFLIVTSNAVLILQTWVVARYTENRTLAISRRLLTHYLAQSYESFIGRRSGDMSTAILSEAETVVQQFMRPLAEIFSATLTVLAVLLTLILIDPLVASISVSTFLLIYGGITLSARKFIKSMGLVRLQSNERRYQIAGEALGGIKDIKLLGREASYVDRFNLASNDMAKANVIISVVAQVPRYAIQIVAFSGIIVLCLALLSSEKLQGRESLGAIIPMIGVLAFAGQRLMPELQKLYVSLTLMTAGTAALERVHTDLLTDKNSQTTQGFSSPLGMKKHIELENINYTYPDAEKAGLRGVSLRINAGERIGVVGASGAGKTTLADVLLGLLLPGSGAMRVDGKLITPSLLRRWQLSAGYVPQEIFISAASLSENIALGVPYDEIDQDRVEHAARVARLDEFAVSELPDGYDTYLGERGVRLSGGQRQRIGIARALYHDVDLIVFDEATSALDNLTEREVMSALQDLPGDKTIMLIAHRLSTVKMCDRIIMMEWGRIIDIGSWDDLMERNKAFRDLATT